MEANDDDGDNDGSIDRAVELLQELGLKEYEAMCLVALSRVPEATAKELSELSDVPRTRVYDATRVLEAQGLVEVQHGSPQKFRAVPVEEAVETLRQQYGSRFDTLQDTLGELEPPQTDADDVHEVWSITGRQAVRNRTRSLFEDAQQELLVVVGGESVLTDDFFEGLGDALDRDISVVVGVQDEPTRERFRDRRPSVQTFVTGLDWLHGPTPEDGETAVTRLLLVDRESILVSASDSRQERAVFGRGFSNGLVVIVRRLMSTGLLPSLDSAGDD